MKPGHFGPSTAPTPKRITLALDARGLHGPDVDRALGVAGFDGADVGVVDAWETGELVPTHAQLLRLAALTGQPLAFFFRPAPHEVSVIVCSRSSGVQRHPAVSHERQQRRLL